MKKNKLCYIFMSLFVAGCSVSETSTTKRAEEVKAEITSHIERQENAIRRGENALYRRVAAVYVGNTASPLAMNATLPAAINEQSFSLPKRTNLATAAKIISKITKFPVRINPDVYLSPRAIVPAIEAPQASEKKEAATNHISAQLNEIDTSLPTDFDGPLKDYLDTICGVLNINWEFEPGKGFYFYRMVTKILEVKLHAGDSAFSSTVSKGSSASTGAAGGAGAGATGSGSYTATTRGTTNANYSPWNALQATLEAIKSPLGKVSVDISANSVMIRDTRDVVDLAEKIVARGNAIHNRQITLTLRTLRVSVDDSSAASADIQATYARLLAGGAPEALYTLKAPGSLVGAEAGGLGYSIVSPLSRWKGTQGLVQAINQLGTIVSDESQTSNTMNRRTVQISQFDTDSYLAETTPASGAALGGSAGTPGLKPATLTTGYFVQVTPSAFDDGNVWLEMTLDQSEKRGPFGTASTGAGETFQQIQLPNTHVDSKNHMVAIKPGESLLLVSVSRDTTTHTRKIGLLGASGNGERRKELKIIIVTPFVRSL